MSEHVDVYSYDGPNVPDAVWRDEPMRFDEVTDIDYDRTRGPNGEPTPYMNGYTWRTPPHWDDECERWKPSGRVWAVCSGEGCDICDDTGVAPTYGETR